MPKLKERLTFPDGTTQSTAALPLSSSLPGSDTQAGAVGTEAASAHGDHRHPKGRTATAADPVAYAVTADPTVDRAQHYLSDPSPGVPAVYNIRGVRDAGDPTLAGDTTIFVADSFGNQVSLDETGLSLQDLNGNVISGTGTGWAFTPALPIPALSSSTPLVESGSGSAGSGTTVSRADHVHPAVVSRYTATIPLRSDSAGTDLATGAWPVEWRIPQASTIKDWVLTAPASSTITLDVRRATYAAFPTFTSLVGSPAPALSGADHNTDATLTGWTTSLAAGDLLRVYVTSVSGCEACTLSLLLERV